MLCLYSVVLLLLNGSALREKLRNVAAYLGMGIWGTVLYYVLLQILLKVQGKELASYQGISGMNESSGRSLSELLKHIYADFGSFTLKGHILFNNVFSCIALLGLLLVLLYTLVHLLAERKLWKNIWFYVVICALTLFLPVATNVILIISPEVTYHLLMRYQWVLYLICAVGFADRFFDAKAKGGSLSRWILTVSAGILIFNYAVTDNIAYSNLEKRYEKTYAYCLRLLDRMEQTPGYYRGIPVAMIGVVGDELYPVTDITGGVTGSMIGIPGDTLLYTADNYQAFMRHYMGVEINPVDIDMMTEIYDSAEYLEMDSFPGADSIRIVDGIMYIKTENRH